MHRPHTAVNTYIPISCVKLRSIRDTKNGHAVLHIGHITRPTTVLLQHPCHAGLPGILSVAYK